MLILTSNGLSSDNIIKKMKEYCDSLSKAVIVTTASVEFKENDWHIPQLTEELKSLGLLVDYFDFDFQRPEVLLNYDVIEINGGNPFYLLNAIKRANCEDIMEKLIREDFFDISRFAGEGNIGHIMEHILLSKDILLV
ncbi:Type 1 glutamine amidotransferase-like domain-containing protein [Clostridium folliculivorans]|uniref:Uncharacterized protein n=1 Tax=Clostridium folliculivorans TaxID=2886038 RepID=A0A9W5Y1W6_9CLOT|nr:Type 1 glutamine amidotransferase-like domain-containing protein [Clostridium folliculivorans]GKU25108.1 hypothetical protein CFOLD11_19340 [Clostridium folliculivorans]GKU31206.1 hypothetical protein CFB3_33130 [Clostridium folliculivorans]